MHQKNRQNNESDQIFDVGVMMVLHTMSVIIRTREEILLNIQVNCLEGNKQVTNTKAGHTRKTD